MRGPLPACGLVLLAGLTALPLTAQSGPLAPATVAPAAVLGPALRAHADVARRLPVALEAGDASAPFQTVDRNRRKGALWGAGVGLVAGGLLGGLTAGSDDDDGFGEWIVASATTGQAVIVGAVVGAAVGVLLGATVLAPSRSGPAGGGSGLAVHVAPPPPGTGAGVRIGLRWCR